MPEHGALLWDTVLVTCEHGGNRVPADYRELFARHHDLLDSHRGYDAGALELARTLSSHAEAPLRFSTTTRLLVDLNRPPDSSSVFSSITRRLPAAQRTHLLEQYHRPHWDAVFARVAAVCSRQGRLLHLGCHSFTTGWHGRERDVDVGLLYDPQRAAERKLCTEWARALSPLLPELRVRRNRPYSGASPGLTSSLRQAWSDAHYLGIEIELSQRLVRAPVAQRRRVQQAVWAALVEVARPSD